MLIIDWKVRALERRLENKALNKRIKELIESSDNWKTKSIAYKAEVDNLREKIDTIKKKINQISEI